jgi:hypothetical protein
VDLLRLAYRPAAGSGHMQTMQTTTSASRRLSWQIHSQQGLLRPSPSHRSSVRGTLSACALGPAVAVPVAEHPRPFKTSRASSAAGDRPEGSAMARGQRRIFSAPTPTGLCLAFAECRHVSFCDEIGNVAAPAQSFRHGACARKLQAATLNGVCGEGTPRTHAVRGTVV